MTRIDRVLPINGPCLLKEDSLTGISSWASSEIPSLYNHWVLWVHVHIGLYEAKQILGKVCKMAQTTCTYIRKWWGRTAQLHSIPILLLIHSIKITLLTFRAFRSAKAGACANAYFRILFLRYSNKSDIYKLFAPQHYLQYAFIRTACTTLNWLHVLMRSSSWCDLFIV